ncbi:MAG: cadherin repeat domain-containing protein, partial [Acidobacteriota bacterium]|nr:cadherin repeat domain-containing protein [Acidobacteriota bacterium]
MFTSHKRTTRTVVVCSALALSVFLLILAVGQWPLPTVKAAVLQLMGKVSNQTGYSLWNSGNRQTMAVASGQNGLAAALNPDGSLRAGAGGSFDASGFRMEYSATGAPRFVAAAACNGWDTQFAPPNGVDESGVYAMAVSGSDIYIGGGFSFAGNVAAKNVAKFNTLTNTWSALGTGGGNGVDNLVRVLALSGSDLYVGGHIGRANFGGTSVSANYVAKVNTMTSVWSALADMGGGNGVNGSVFALALSGSDLFAGGQFTRAGDNKASQNIGRFCGSSNSPPTISAVGVTRTAGAGGSNSTIANVNDAEDAENTLAVTVNGVVVTGVTTVTVNGVTISNLTVDAAGAVNANVVAACGASQANFTLNVTDSGGLMMTATLNVTVTANTPPTLGNYPSAGTINVGTGTTVTPSASPTDNGTISSITASAPGFTGSFSVNPTTGVVTISNAGPGGNYTVTVTATDNCSAASTTTFTLTVDNSLSCVTNPIVTNNSDSLAGSLRQAIAKA